ncbi:MFS transporter [Sorangium sp. So ce327]|uniref:MFS transporter n=1 Tax=unclassified Sorangium TaxID=2621164 RepID=UPI003F5FC466
MPGSAASSASHQYAWVTIAYLLTSSVLVPICGKLSDIYGRNPILLFGVAVFLIGSIASGAASRLLRAEGARGLDPSILQHLAPPSEAGVG